MTWHTDLPLVLRSACLAARMKSPNPLYSSHLARQGPEPAEDGWAKHVCSARVDQTSTCGANAKVSSTSIARYRTVLSSAAPRVPALAAGPVCRL
jgi:hypothetical protein